MKALYAFCLLILLSFIGSRFMVRSKKLSPLSYLYISGLPYIVLGLFLGHQGLNVLSQQVLKGLTPLISFGLGWIGFLFGFQFEARYLRRFSSKYKGLSILLSLFVFLFGFGVMLALLPRLFPGQPSYLLHGLALALGLVATATSPTLVNAAAFTIRTRGDFFYLARFLTSVSGFWAIFGLSLLFSFWHFPVEDRRSLFYGTALLLGSTAVPAILGFLFHFLTKKKTSEQEILVFVLGLVFFVSGIAFYFNFSPLYMAMVMGVVYSNLTKSQEKLYPLLLSAEKPIYIILLMLIGAFWSLRLDWVTVALVSAFISARIIGYAVALPLFRVLLKFPFPLPPSFGWAFLSFGGIGLALAVSLKLAYPIALTDVFLTVTLLAVMVSEFLSPVAFQRTIQNLDSEERS